MADQAAEALGSLSLGAEERQPASAAAPAERQRGTVRWFNASKGFGFIQPESAEGEPEGQEAGTDLFVHQTSIRAEGFRSLREGEPVEFDIEPGEDGRNKAINVSGPGGAPPLGAPKRPQLQQRRQQQQQFQPQQQQPPSPLMMAAQQQQQHMQPFGTGGYGYPAAMYPPSQFVPPTGPPGGYQGALAQQMAMQYGQRGGGDPSTAGGMPMRPPMGLGFPGGRGGRGGRGYLAAPGSGVPIADRRPPPGTPGISSGLQVVVHNLPWTCSWQQLKDAFVEAGVPNIERADVIIDSSGRSRGFGTVSFPTPQDAANAVQMMNNADIGGRAVTVRIDRFA